MKLPKRKWILESQNNTKLHVILGLHFDRQQIEINIQRRRGEKRSTLQRQYQRHIKLMETGIWLPIGRKPETFSAKFCGQCVRIEVWDKKKS